MKPKAIFIDIDGTLTDNQPGNAYPLEKHVWQNPIFGVIRDVMVEKGWKPEEARQKIEEYADSIIWWDYPDFIAEFSLPPVETWERIYDWHRQYLMVYEDGVEMVKELFKQGWPLFVVSNNPIVGCLLKLKRAGLGDITGSSYFRRILGANILRGQKSQPALWQKAFAQVGVDPAQSAVIGDNPREDGDIPLGLGLGRAVIVCRTMEEEMRSHGRHIFLQSLSQVPALLEK